MRALLETGPGHNWPLRHVMILTRNQFNDEIKSFQLKNFNNWALLSKNNLYISQLYLKMSADLGQMQLEAYIVYSESYQVPVLYFLPLINSEESSRFAKIDELIPLLESDPGSIDLAENPVNGLIMYHVHPCLTSKFMAEVLGNSTRNGNLIKSWLSFCPLIPIKKLSYK